MTINTLYYIIDGCIVNFNTSVRMQDAIVAVHANNTTNNTPRHNPPLLWVGKLCRKRIFDMGV